MHPAPPGAWKPLSALAVTSFVLSLLLILIALPGFWITEAFPLALGIYTLMKVKAGQKRGRMLAVWAIVISLAIGSCTFVMHQGMRGVLTGTAESILSILSSKDSDASKDKSLRSWAWPTALEDDADLTKDWLARYDAVVSEYGPWSETFDMPSIIYGSTPLLIAPEGIVEVGTVDKKPSDWTMGSAIWAPAVFEKGVVYIVLVLQAGDKKGVEALSKLRPGEETAVLGDVRFFRTKAAKP